MALTTVIVSSITYAMKGQRILANNGFGSYVDRDIKAYGKYGCGYCIRITSGDPGRAVELLRAHQIKIKEVVTG